MLYCWDWAKLGNLWDTFVALENYYKTWKWEPGGGKENKATKDEQGQKKHKLTNSGEASITIQKNICKTTQKLTKDPKIRLDVCKTQQLLHSTVYKRNNGNFLFSFPTRHNKSRADVINEEKMAIWKSEGTELENRMEMRSTFRDNSLFIYCTFYAHCVLLIFLSPGRIPNEAGKR